VPWIIDYPVVLERARQMKLQSLYPGSGAFGFAPPEVPVARGWVGPPDPTIRPEAAAFVRAVPAPFEATLTSMFIRAWQDLVPGRLWLMHKSRWHYELNFGSTPWLAATLEHVDIDPGQLQERNNGSAIEFEPDEPDRAAHVVQKLLENLMGSDFAVMFPDHPVLATVHHHKQIWWTTTDATRAARLDGM